MEFERRRSSGTAKAGLATGIVGSSLGALAMLGNGANAMRNWDNGNCNGWNNCGPVVVPVATGFGFGGPWGYNGYNNSGCSDDHFVNRYEMTAENKLAQKDSEIAMLKSDRTTDAKLLELYKYIDGKFIGFEKQFCSQEVQNQATKDSFQLLSERIQCNFNDVNQKIANECRERRCADNTLVAYMNATFYPKMVADVTTGTTTTAQTLYNPLPTDTCDCKCG